jgi:hypothetical protein
VKQKPVIPLNDLHLLASPRGLIIVLWTIREQSPITFDGLLKTIFQAPEGHVAGTERVNVSNAARYLADAVKRLVDNGLVELLDTDHNILDAQLLNASTRELLAQASNYVLHVTDTLAFIQDIFELSLYQRAVGKDTQLRFSPSFGNPHPGNWPDVFVVMPFRRELAQTYDNILSVARSLELSCKRGDEFLSDESIMTEIWSALWHARVCIADCTDRNANVFYELGIAHTIGKPTILLAQSQEDIPFDVQHRRVIIYENTPKGLRSFRDTLAKALQEELGLETNKLYEILDKLDG